MIFIKRILGQKWLGILFSFAFIGYTEKEGYFEERKAGSRKSEKRRL